MAIAQINEANIGGREMGTFYTVDAEFWTDPDVVDNLTPEDKYFYLYLLTNPHGNCAGCFQISVKQIADELGYSRETVERLIERFVSVHKMIDYDKENKEILIIKWGKRHWTKSDKHISAVKKKIDVIKTDRFRDYLLFVQKEFSEQDDMVWIGYRYPMDTLIYPISYNTSISPISEEKEEGGMGEEEKVAVISLVLNDKSEYPIYQDYIDQMQDLYPAVNVEVEFRKMSAWCINNPDKRKTKKGITRFINSWLSREQDKGGSGGGYKKGKSFLDMYKEMCNEEEGNSSTIIAY